MRLKHVGANSVTSVTAYVILYSYIQVNKLVQIKSIQNTHGETIKKKRTEIVYSSPLIFEKCAVRQEVNIVSSSVI